jgi:hypothetical protein
VLADFFFILSPKYGSCRFAEVLFPPARCPTARLGGGPSRDLGTSASGSSGAAG